ncbi:hypothetical protein ACFZB9_21450 [Kitasatospora sp. NPDC008050]|uniref:hypothetical protein n=1 Tax=Kitasatospora sp. NPDC008050 TaxID=3364021 RepID=UPI0036E9D5E3
MTDHQKPGPSGGDCDGTPLENLLREAMSARAAQITAGSLRPAAPPVRRLRRTRPLYTVALPLVGLAAAASIGYLGFRSDTVADHVVPPPAAVLHTSAAPSATPSASPSPSDSPSPSPSPSTAATPSGSATPDGAASGTPGADNGRTSGPTTTGSPVSGDSPSAPASATGTPYTFRGVSFTLPTGWTTQAIGFNGNTSPFETMLCLMTPDPKPSTGWACGPYGVSLTVYSTPYEAAQASYPTLGDLDSDGGWAHQPYCYSWDNPHGTGSQHTTSVDHSTVTVAGKQATRSTWQVACDSGESFTGRMWGFRTDQVFVGANGLSPADEGGLQAILNSLDFGSHHSPQGPAPASGQVGDVTTAFSGLTANQSVRKDGSAQLFSVTWTNTGRSSYGAVLLSLCGSGPGGTGSSTDGTLERQDGTGWTTVPLGCDGLTDAQGTPLSVPLAPGQSRTVNYRLTVPTTAKPGQLTMVAHADLELGSVTALTQIGGGTVTVQIPAG